MGHSIAWLAVQTTDHDSLFEEAGVRRTDTVADLTSPLSGVALHGGWFVLVGLGCDHRVIQARLLGALSSRWPLVASSIEEHVMFCTVAHWRAGAEVWFASHDALKGKLNLDVRGHLPASYDHIRRHKVEQQGAQGGESADVDCIFDIPLLLGKELTGFRHDDDDPTCFAEPNPVAFIDLQQRSRPWWRAW